MPGGKPPASVLLPNDMLETEKNSRAWFQYPGAVNAGWLLTLRLATNRIEMGKPIPAAVVYQNVSTNKLKLFIANPGLPYMFSPRVFSEPEAKELTMAGKALEKMEDGGAKLTTFRDVPPSEKFAFPVELDEYFDFNKPGIYQIRISAHGPFMDSQPATGIAKIKILPPADKNP